MKPNKNKGKGYKDQGNEEMMDMKSMDSSQEEGKDDNEEAIKVTNMVKLELSKEDEKKLLKQISGEYSFATKGLKLWIDKNLRRLKLYNNQTRGDQFVGEPLIYSHMDTWMSALFNDRMDQVFAPNETGDIPTAENLTNMAKYDYELMGMDELNRDQGWDTLFFAYGLKDWLEFDYKKKCPSPYVLDPLTFYYDTLGTSIDGNASGKGGMRFLGWDIYMNQLDVLKNPLLGEDGLAQLKKCRKDDKGVTADKARRERMEAMGGSYEHLDEDLNDNSVYGTIHWRTTWNGKKIAVYLTSDQKYLLGACELPYDKDTGYTTWWVAAKKYSPQPHQFKGVSLTDLLEDKQRKKAELVNDMFKLARATVFGSYAYDKSAIDNGVDLAFGYDKWIPTNGNPNLAIAPIRKDVPNSALIDNALNYIDLSAQKASATSELQQGVQSKDSRTASELNLMAQMTQTRYSLVAKSFAQGDRDDWRLWYLSYKLNFEDGLGKKIVRIGGSGYKIFRPLNKKDIVCKIDPDVHVDSVELTRAKKQREYSMFSQAFGVVINDPAGDRRAGERHLLYLSGLERETVDSLLPPTPDEIIAREQNDLINQGKEPEFLTNENHVVHIRIHMEAMEGAIKENHIKTHIQAMKLIQENPALSPTSTGMQEGETTPKGASNAAQGSSNAPVPATASADATLSNQGR